MRSFQYKTFVDVPFKDIPFDELGAAGWELVAAVPSMFGGLTKYIFKKCLQDEVIRGGSLETAPGSLYDAYEAEGEFKDGL